MSKAGSNATEASSVSRTIVSLNPGALDNLMRTMGSSFLGRKKETAVADLQFSLMESAGLAAFAVI